jgi:membrane-associated phospholipid phosphatase
MNLALLIGLIVACVVIMVIERFGLPTTLQLSFRGDIKRETQFLAQYGQAVCTVVVGVLVWELDPGHRNYIVPLVITVAVTSFAAFVIKRVGGRMRPKHPNAGRFMGPSLKHDNARESFPSSHSACAMALSVMLAHAYPQAAGAFWTLALITAALRYVLDAHWPSDVVGGIALGYGMAWVMIRAFGV